MFENYLSRPNVRQPILTQYCDGQRVTCPDWMSQWGSKYLGDQGYSAIDILRSYYGNDMYINSADGISGIPASWPGYDLGVGASDQRYVSCRNSWQEFRVLIRRYRRLRRTEFTDQGRGKRWKSFIGFRTSGNRYSGLSDLV